MTYARPSEGLGNRRGRRVLPYLALAVGLVLATLPTWWMMAFGVELEIDTLLTLRCASRPTF